MFDKVTGILLCTASHPKMNAGGGLRNDALFSMNMGTQLVSEKERGSNPRLLVTDPSMISGTAAPELKQRLFDVLGIWSQNGLFAGDISRAISIKQIDAEKVGKILNPTLVGEIEVTQGESCSSRITRMFISL